MRCCRCTGEIAEDPDDGPDELLIRQLIHSREECPGRNIPDEAECGLCGELIVSSRSVNDRLTWCHAEVPNVGHEALYAVPEGAPE